MTREANSRIASRPFIIWTLQRTGGTNLTAQLIQRSRLKPRQHEPFNRQRELGGITQHWHKTADETALAASMEEVCSVPRPIKHCLEQVPWAVSEALLHASVAAGYRHLFLYRREPIGRLLSVEYARRTGVWGVNHLHKTENEDHAFAKPLDIERLVQHELRCVYLLCAVRDLYGIEHGVRPITLAYEDVYGDDERCARQRLRKALAQMDLSRGKSVDVKFVNSIRERGNQGTRDRYERFEGRDELARRLRGVPRFHPRASRDDYLIEAMRHGREFEFERGRGNTSGTLVANACHSLRRRMGLD